MQDFITLISWIYLITNTVRIFFYAPQIHAVFKASDGASAVSIMTWGFWTFANFTAALYGWFAIHDTDFTAIFVGNFLCTGLVTLIAAVKRVNYKLNVEAHG